MSVWFIVFCYSLLAYGFSTMFVFFSGPFNIFDSIRYHARNISDSFGDMMSCMMCLPTNFGWVFSLLNYLFLPIPITPFNIIFAMFPQTWYYAIVVSLCDGIYTGGIVWIIHHIELFFENIATGNVNQQASLEDDEDIIETEDITLK